MQQTSHAIPCKPLERFAANHLRGCFFCPSFPPSGCLTLRKTNTKTWQIV
nr:MAG TPA: hypothetical protein [Caudoviricetes sp.]